MVLSGSAQLQAGLATSAQHELAQNAKKTLYAAHIPHIGVRSYAIVNIRCGRLQTVPVMVTVSGRMRLA